MKKTDIKDVRLGDNQFLLRLTGRGTVYEGYEPDTVIKVAACEGYAGDWTAYFVTPNTPFGDVLKYGNKLPEETARELFPEWARTSLKWRD